MKIRFSFYIVLTFLLCTGCSVRKTAEANIGRSTTSPYAITVDQSDGSEIDIIGKGNRNNPYTETLDGYTLLRNEERIYEYALPGNNNELVCSGIKATNTEDRSKKEKKFLRTIEKHLRNPKNQSDENL